MIKLVLLGALLAVPFLAFCDWHDDTSLARVEARRARVEAVRDGRLARMETRRALREAEREFRHTARDAMRDTKREARRAVREARARNRDF